MLKGDNHEYSPPQKRPNKKKKTPLLLQNTFLVHFFAIDLHDYTAKLRSFSFEFYRGNVV